MPFDNEPGTINTFSAMYKRITDLDTEVAKLKMSLNTTRLVGICYVVGHIIFTLMGKT